MDKKKEVKNAGVQIGIERQGIMSAIITDSVGDLIAKSMMTNDLIKEGWTVMFEPFHDNENIIQMKFTRGWHTQ